MKLRIDNMTYGHVQQRAQALGLTVGEIVRRCVLHCRRSGYVAEMENRRVATRNDSTVITLPDDIGIDGIDPDQLRMMIAHAIAATRVQRPPLAVPNLVPGRDYTVTGAE